MKALFFDNDLFMGMREVSHPQPEYLMPIPKNRHTNMEGELLDQMSVPTMLKMVYRIQDYGREFIIYKLYGFDD